MKLETDIAKFIKSTLLVTMLVGALPGLAQPEKWGEGEIETVEIEIVKEKQIVLPKANRNFEKVAPRPAEPIKPAITYDFTNLRFTTPDFNPSIRPLRLKQEEIPKIYGNYISAGVGNYLSPYLDAYLTTKRDKKKFYGMKFFHHSFGEGPVDDKNSGSSNTQVHLFGKTFGKSASTGGFMNYDRIGTYFYGYTPGTDINRDLIKQTYSIVSLGTQLQNVTTGDFNYELRGSFSYLIDHYAARESEVALGFTSDYKVTKNSKLLLNSNYFLITRKDELVEAKPRHIFKVNGGYQFFPIEHLSLTAAATVVLENDTIGKDKSIHIFPDLRATYPLGKSVEVYAGLTGDIDKVSLHTLARENAWLNANIGIFNTNRTIEFNGGLKGKLGKLAVGTGFAFANLKDFYYYQNDQTDRSRFVTVFDEGNTGRTTLFAEVGLNQAEAVRMMVRGDYYMYSTGNEPEAWHRPRYRVAVNSSYNLYSKLLFNVDLAAQGGARALDVDSDTIVELDAAFDLNVKASYFISKQFSVFVKGSNLLSNDYQLYLNYPVRGLQVMGGITWVF